MKRITASLLIILVSLLSHAQQTADRIFINAKIWTGDAANPWSTCIGMKDSVVVFVGNDCKNYKGNNTTVTDLHGKLVLPGFIDNHTHFLQGGFQLVSVNLRQVKTQEQFINTLKQYTIALTDKRWVLGGDWDHEAWGGDLPSKKWIDAVTGEHAVLLSRYDGHMALANSKALQLAGITSKTADPAGGTIEKDANGEPTGILRDEAMGLVYNIIPQPTTAELDEAFQRAMAHALSLGVTQVHDMGSYGGWTDRATYERAYKNNKLNIRIYSFASINTWQLLSQYIIKNGRGDDMLRWGGLKGFVDGSLGSTTAWFYAPYLDAPNTAGLQVTDTISLRKWIIAADAAGLQVATHAIGDRANDWLLETYAEAIKQNGERDRRFRVEHAQHLTPAGIKNFGLQHVIPSMQPYHAIDDGKWAYKRLDDTRLRGTYAFKSLLASKATLTFGSDWTVAPLNPLEGIYAAVTRRTLDNKNPNGWYPDEKISVEDAVRCYTASNAYAGFQENKLGILKAGMLADLVVLSENILTIKPEKIKDVKVLLTVVNGKEVYKLQD